MLAERRRSAFSWELMVRVGLAWVLVSALLLATNFTSIRAFVFPDPDDVMRLVQVRDLYAGQSWFDVTQHRVDAASGGLPMHWSRLVDLPLLAVIAALTPIVGQADAELAALIVVPLVSLGLAMLLAARIAWRLLGGEASTMSAIVMALSVPLLFQLSPMRIDHHGWQIVLALAAMNGLMARNAIVGGWVSGIAIAAWLSISIEGLPLAAAICAVATFRWWRNRADRVWLVHTMQALAAGSIAIYLFTRGVGELATHCDAIGPVHLGMFAWGALVLGATAKAEPLPRAGLLLGFAIAGAGALGFYLVSVPQCATGGGFAGMDPLLDKYWLSHVSEGQPIWRQTLETAIQIVALPLLGLFASVRLALSSHQWLRRWWIDYSCILLAAFVVALFVARAGAVAAALAAVPVGWQLHIWLRNIRNMKRPGMRVLALAGVAIALLPAMPLMLLTTAIPVQASNAPTGTAPALAKASACDVAGRADALNALPSGEIYAPLDIGPQLLLHTRHSVIATGHHRGEAGMLFVIENALARPEVVRKALAERGSDYVALCAGLNEAGLYRASNPDGFVANLTSRSAPEWLEPVDLGDDSGLLVWRVRAD